MGSEVSAAIPATVEARVAAGERLADGEVALLAGAPDLLALGMLADETRRRRVGTTTSFSRVCVVPIARILDGVTVPAAATEVRLEGTPASLADAVRAVQVLRRAAGPRTVSACSLAALVDASAQGWGTLDAILAALRDAGLDAVAEVPVDRLADAPAAIAAARAAGLAVTRLTVEQPHPRGRADLVLRARAIAEAVGGILAFAPLPAVVPVTAPTTGYDDVRTVAVARLALDTVPHVQVDWRRYGPKLAQVALTFGADDLDAVSPEADTGEGPRRAPLEDIRRQIRAAGFEPQERDAGYAAVAG
jgi:aminodeoxyfutalosine synthase